MNRKEALAFVERHGVVLQAARGPLPNLAEWIVGGRIRGRDRKILGRTAYFSRRKRRRNHESFGLSQKSQLADKLLTEGGGSRTRGPQLIGRIATLDNAFL